MKKWIKKNRFNITALLFFVICIVVVFVLSDSKPKLPSGTFPLDKALVDNDNYIMAVEHLGNKFILMKMQGEIAIVKVDTLIFPATK